MAVLGPEESGRYRQVTVLGREECNMTPLHSRGCNIFNLNEMLIVARKFVIQSKHIDNIETKQKKKPAMHGMDQFNFRHVLQYKM